MTRAMVPRSSRHRKGRHRRVFDTPWVEVSWIGPIPRGALWWRWQAWLDLPAGGINLFGKLAREAPRCLPLLPLAGNTHKSASRHGRRELAAVDDPSVGRRIEAAAILHCLGGWSLRAVARRLDAAAWAHAPEAALAQARRDVKAGCLRLARQGVLPFAAFASGDLPADWPHDPQFAACMTAWTRAAELRVALHREVGDPLPTAPPTIGEVHEEEMQRLLLAATGGVDMRNEIAQAGRIILRAHAERQHEIASLFAAPWEPPATT